ncbi:Germin-like protein subfamily 1 member 14 [Morella rubra]|uniref:Germin-like protein n=1 Tax=Morella rubra TaxID=262757 RepID=A0A6A1VHC5_9ROSI|nr:Germin-like protein subfamily 1 member 14 [Morella rubra]KAB1212161.1 Germin-like protein subfamily 1 member 14 [Morella rubra]
MEKGVPMFLVTVLLFALACSQLASASDPSPLQDFCVATKDSKEFVNVESSAITRKVDDFFFSELDKLGISVARIDFAPYGLNPPHTYSHATEIIVVLEGTLYVGFVTSNTDNHLFTKVLKKGDVFVFPIGLIHFQWNMGNTDALVFVALSNHNLGVITIADAIFGANPPINRDVLSKAF